MESLYRKYRPQTFADVVGQQHVVGTLEHAVLEGRTSHAYLFCGPRGTGKTTMARLLAKALMCEQGPGHLPDGTCEQCQLIASGEHPDVYELDAASRTGVDNVREEIINRVDYAPVQGRYKVYIIDEVHMLTTAAFNALLKTLEEPPAHVVFVLCTTDPQKIPATILSRVQRFDFRPIGNDDILARLVHVCEQEGFTYEDAALDLVVRNARGGMRDALSTLEQLSVFGGGVIGLEAAQDMLGAVTGAALEHVVDALAARDVAALFAQVGELVNAGRDLLQFTRELAAHLRDVYVVAAVGANPNVLPAASDAQRLSAEAAAFGSTDRLARALTLLGDVSREMTTAPNQRLVLEIAFTRMARPESDLTLESLAERLAQLERQVAQGVVAAVAPAGAEKPVLTPASSLQPAEKTTPVSQGVLQSTAPQSAPQVAPQSASQPVAQAPAPQPAAQPNAASRPASQPSTPQGGPAQPASQTARRPVSQSNVPQPAPAYAAPVQAPASQPAPTYSSPAPAPATPPKQAQPSNKPQAVASSAGLEGGALQRTWRQAVAELTTRLPSRGSLLSSAMASSDDGSELVVNLPKGSGFALKMLERADVRSAVEGVVSEFFGPRKLVFLEGLGASDLKIPAFATQPAAQPAPSSAAPQPSAQPTAPTPQPVAEPQPAPTPAPQPASSSPYDSAPQPAPYPMPWDDPASAPMPEPEPDYVPYDDYDAIPFEASDEPFVPEPAPASGPAFGVAQTFGHVSTAATPPASSPAPTPAPSATTPASASPVPAPKTSADSPASPALAPEPSKDTPPEAPTDLPPELSTILENAFEVFGSDVRVSR